MNTDEARARRREFASKYKPDEVDLLLVAEAPPSALDRYFYFEDVWEQDSLFRYICKHILGRISSRSEKATALGELRDRSVFLIDLKEDPKNGTDLAAEVPGLAKRCQDVGARRVILIKANVYDLAFRALRDAGVPVVDERIPFPGSGQQRKFDELFERALQT